MRLAWVLAAKPRRWAHKRALPLHKKGDIACYDKYRILAISCSMNQWFEQLWLARASPSIGVRIDPAQLGCRDTTAVHIFALLETLRLRAAAGVDVGGGAAAAVEARCRPQVTKNI